MGVIDAMNRRKLIFLLVPSVVLLMFSAGALFIYVQDTKAWQANAQNKSVHETFIESVRSGRRQLTTDDWIKDSNAAANWAESERGLARTNARALRDFGLGSLVLALAQLWFVLWVREDSTKQ